MNYCSNCGKQVKEDASYCSDCGQKFVEQETEQLGVASDQKKLAKQSKLTIHDLDAKELLILKQEVNRRKKSTAVTWTLWVFLDIFGAHRFYLGDYGKAIGMLMTLGGLFIWSFIDGFFIPSALRRKEMDVRDEVLLEIASRR